MESLFIFDSVRSLRNLNEKEKRFRQDVILDAWTVFGVWKWDGFSNLKKTSESDQDSKLWNRSGVGKCDSGNLWGMQMYVKWPHREMKLCPGYLKALHTLSPPFAGWLIAVNLCWFAISSLQNMSQFSLET